MIPACISVTVKHCRHSELLKCMHAVALLKLRLSFQTGIKMGYLVYFHQVQPLWIRRSSDAFQPLLSPLFCSITKDLIITMIKNKEQEYSLLPLGWLWAMCLFISFSLYLWKEGAVRSNLPNVTQLLSCKDAIPIHAHNYHSLIAPISKQLQI